MPVYSAPTSRSLHASESSPLLQDNPKLGTSESVFKGWRLSLMNTRRSVQWFFSKLTCGLIRDPYRSRKASDFTRTATAGNRRDSTFSSRSLARGSRAADFSPALQRCASLPCVNTPQEVEATPHFFASDEIASLGKKNAADGTQGIEKAAASVAKKAPAEQKKSEFEEKAAVLMKENAVKREKLETWLANRNTVIRKIAGRTQSRLEARELRRASSLSINGEEFDVPCPKYEQHLRLTDAVQEMFMGFEKDPARRLGTPVLAQYGAPWLFFKTHFEADFSVPAESDDLLDCKELEKAYFNIFEELLVMVGGKKCDTSQCYNLFLDLRQDALREICGKGSESLSGDGYLALAQQYKKDFEEKLDSLTDQEKNNPFLLQIAHQSVALKPLPGMQPDVVDRLNRSLTCRAPARFLLPKMASELIAVANDGPRTVEQRLSTPALLPPWRAGHKLALQREKALEMITGKIGKAMPAAVNVRGSESFLCITTPKEEQEGDKVREFAGICGRNQAEFLVRGAGFAGGKNARMIFFKTHYEMPPLGRDAGQYFSDPQYQDLLKDAQADLSERLIVAAVENEIGVGKAPVSSAEIERLFCKHFEAERIGMLRGFLQTVPAGLFKLLKISEEEAMSSFEEDFKNALGDSRIGVKDYIHDRLLPAHLSVKLQHHIEASGERSEKSERIENILFPLLEHGMQPSILLARVAEKVITEIVEQVTEKIAAKAATEAPGVASVATEILADLEKSKAEEGGRDQTDGRKKSGELEKNKPATVRPRKKSNAAMPVRKSPEILVEPPHIDAGFGLGAGMHSHFSYV